MVTEQKSNYWKFIGSFNELHEVMKERLNSQDPQFGRLLELAKRNNDKVIMAYHKQIDFYRDFRNLLVHETTDGLTPIAEPNESIINEIIKVTEQIRDPKKVYELFLSDVIKFDIKESLADVLTVVNEKQYSQFPVFDDNELVGLITENGITHFLASSIEDDLISISETTIGDVIDVDEAKDAIRIINSNTSLYDVEEIFNKKLKEGNSLFAILISNNGHKVVEPKDIAGIITPWDLPKILDNI